MNFLQVTDIKARGALSGCQFGTTKPIWSAITYNYILGHQSKIYIYFHFPSDSPTSPALLQNWTWNLKKNNSKTGVKTDI